MAAARVETGVYFIQNVNTGTVMDLTNGSAVDGNPTQGYEKRELSDLLSPTQLWLISETNTGVYTIQNANSRTFATLANAHDGTPIVGSHFTGSSNQYWSITRDPTRKAYSIENQATGTVIDLYGLGTANGTRINGWTILHNDNQLWHIVRA